jgi:hypothetical protein
MIAIGHMARLVRHAGGSDVSEPGLVYGAQVNGPNLQRARGRVVTQLAARPAGSPPCDGHEASVRQCSVRLASLDRVLLIAAEGGGVAAVAALLSSWLQQ